LDKSFVASLNLVPASRQSLQIGDSDLQLNIFKGEAGEYLGKFVEAPLSLDHLSMITLNIKSHIQALFQDEKPPFLSFIIISPL